MVEGLISEKGDGITEAKKRAELLQQEAKDLLLQASDKLQLLKGTIASDVDMHRDAILHRLCVNRYKRRISVCPYMQCS